MENLYDENNVVTVELTTSLQKNIEIYETLFENCSDVIKRKFTIGDQNKIDIYLTYIDNIVDKELLEELSLKNLLYGMGNFPSKGQFEYIKEKGLRTADVSVVTSMQDITQAVLSGDSILMVDGYAKAYKIASKSYPSRGVSSAESEVVIRGSKESFTEPISTNKVLIRRRIRDTKLKIKQEKIGIRSNTDVAILYMEDIVRKDILEEIENRLKDFVIDGILDSGMLEQLTESSWASPFPQFQSTERPDKAASAILEGRIVLLVDNSPMALILPTTLNSFFQASDDYYSRWEVATLIRLLRYIAAFMAVALPGLYIVILNFHSEIIPTALALSFAAARQGVPFSVVFEVIIMEIAFELLREAGIRVPGPMGNTIGIVGGLIIGNAAVEANLVSPMIVIIVSITAIASFAVPNEAFSSAFRITRYMTIILSALLGLLGFLVSIMLILIHLTGLRSFGIPYLMPYVSTGMKESMETKDGIIRYPIYAMKNRPIYANNHEKVRLAKKGQRNIKK